MTWMPIDRNGFDLDSERLFGKGVQMAQKSDHENEIERLLNLLKRREAQLVHAYDWRYEKELELTDLKQQLVETKAEVERLKRGDFTEEDFQNEAAAFANSIGGLDKAIAVLQILKVAKEVQ
jgi:hypothetical protein